MRELLDFDRRYGTDTEGEIPVEYLGLEPELAPQAVSYEPTDPGALKVMLAQLPLDPGGYTFIDLGSGKGRVVLLAARYGFGSVVGVEASTFLHQIARRNLSAWGRAGHETRNICLQQGDAGAYALPDRPCVVYLFNPFRERTVARVLLQVKWSLQRCPRDLWLLYYNPQCGYQLESAAYLARVTGARGIGQGDFGLWRSYGENAGHSGSGQS